MLSKLSNYFRYNSALATIRKAGIWFVDIPRTSSSSVRTELSNHFGSAFGKSDLQDENYNNQHQAIPSHLTAREMRIRLGDQTWTDLYTFSLVRNPWCRMLSLYNYRKSEGDIDPRFTFEGYLRLFFEPPENRNSPYYYHGYYYQCIDYLVDENGEIMVDHIVQYETRMDDLRFIGDKCQCPGLGNLFLQHSNARHGYRKFYNKNTRELVETICQKDIKAFDYKF
jgi:hypothetical protein